jgi:sodium-dependent dicarboxylate transporter 2/3/5
MLLPSLFPTAPVLSFLNKNSLLLGTALVTVLCVLKFEDGPVLRMGPTMGEFAWPTYFLCVSAIYLGNVLTDQSTGITVLLNTILGPIFNGMSTTVFTVVVILVCVVLTNISNSLVIGMIMQPVILTFCNAAGINPAPIISLMIFAVLSSACATPAASPFAAMLFGNKEYLSSGDVYKFSGLFVIIEVIFVLVVGIPFFNMLIK